MSHRKTRGSKPALRMLLLFYAAMVALPLFTCFAAYSQALHFAIAQEMETQSTMAEIGMERLESSLKDADAYAESLMRLQCFEEYLRMAGTQKNKLTAQMRAVMDVLPALNDPGDILSSCYIYSASSDSILTAQAGYLHLPIYYEGIFSLEGYGYEDWYGDILRDASFSRLLATAAGAKDSTILYSRRLSYGTRNQGRILFYLDGKGILEAFNHYSAYDALGFLSLFDAQGNILYTTNAAVGAQSLFSQYGAFDGFFEISTMGQSMILCAKPLETYGLTLYIGTPKAYFTRSALELSLEIAWGLIPLVLLSTILMLVLMRNSHRPIQQTIARFSGAAEPATLNPFKYVQQSMERLVEQNCRQELQLQNSRADLRNAMLSALVYPKVSDGFPLADKLAELGFSLDAEHYRAVALSLYAQDGGAPLAIAERTHMVILDLAKGWETEFCYLSMDGPERMLFLAMLDDAPDRFEQMQRTLSQFCYEIAQTLACDAILFVGCECDQLKYVSHSFRTLRDLSPASGGYLVCAQDLRGNSTYYDYTSEDEKLLRHFASGGNSSALQEHLRQLYARNSAENACSPFEKQLLCAHMLNTLRAAGYHEALDDEIVHSLADISLERFFALLGSYYETLCQRSRESQQHAQDQLMREILAHIAAHFMEYDMNLVGVALKFGVSDRRLSQWIRQETGVGFPEYVEKLRMERAIELLGDSRRTIEEIAQMIGYASDKSFRRAFKRFTGQAPSMHRRP